MKILLIARTISIKEGQGRYAFSLIEELSKKNKLIVLAYELEGKDNFSNNPNIEIHQIPDLYTLNNFINPIKYFFQTLKFSFKVDLVHILTDFPYYILFCSLPWIKNKPFVISSIGTYGLVSLEKNWRRPFLKLAYRRAKKVICISKFTQKELLKREKLNNTEVISCGVDLNHWHIDYPVSKFEEKAILGVGGLKDRKGYHISIAAVGEVKKKYPNLKYYIVGDQSEKKYFDRLKNLVKEYQLENNVIFLEKISDHDLIKLYHQVNLFLLTSINVGHKFEGFGLVHLEASACGLPTIGTYNCGAEEAIEEGVSGFLVPQNDIKATTEAILKILENKDLAKKIGESGYKMAQEFSWEKITEKYQVIYSQIY